MLGRATIDDDKPSDGQKFLETYSRLDSH